MAFSVSILLLFTISSVLGEVCNSFKTQEECDGQTPEGGTKVCKWAVVPGIGIYSGLRCTACSVFANDTDCGVCDEGSYSSAACPSSIGCTPKTSAPYCIGTMTIPDIFFTDGSCVGEDKAACKAISSDCSWWGNKDSKTECANNGTKCQCYNKTAHCSDNDTNDCGSCHSENTCLNKEGSGYKGNKTCRWTSLYNGVCTSCGDISKGADCGNCNGDTVSCLLIDGCSATWDEAQGCTGTMNMNGAATVSVHTFIILFLLFLSFIAF